MTAGAIFARQELCKELLSFDGRGLSTRQMLLLSCKYNVHKEDEDEDHGDKKRLRYE